MPFNEQEKKRIIKNTDNQYSPRVKFFDQDIGEFVAVVNSNKKITELDLNYHNIGLDGAKQLVKLENVTYIDLAANNLNDAAVQILVTKSNFKYLDLSENDSITDKGATILLQSLKNRKLQFDLAKCQGISKDMYEQISKTKKELKLSELNKKPTRTRKSKNLPNFHYLFAGQQYLQHTIKGNSYVPPIIS